jgi:hypothetical protein
MKTVANRSKLQSLAKELASYSQEQREALQARIGLMPTIEGRRLSLVNTFVVLQQNPDATVIGGFQQWKRAGRTVSKGQKGAWIFIPCKKKGSDETFFKMCPMFDISQTEEIAETEKKELTV